MFPLTLNEPINKKDEGNFEALLHLEKNKAELRTSYEQGRQLTTIRR